MNSLVRLRRKRSLHSIRHFFPRRCRCRCRRHRCPFLLPAFCLFILFIVIMVRTLFSYAFSVVGFVSKSTEKSNKSISKVSFKKCFSLPPNFLFLSFCSICGWCRRVDHLNNVRLWRSHALRLCACKLAMRMLIQMQRKKTKNAFYSAFG